MDIKANLLHQLQAALKKSGFASGIPISLEHPNQPEHGDYSTNIALLLAKSLKKAPMELAQTIVTNFDTGTQLVAKLEVAPPGFINFYLTPKVVYQTVLTRLQATLQAQTTKPPVKSTQKYIIEHTSVNPNKAMHIGHLRNAIIGDSLVRLFKYAGYQVETQNYIDDTGLQVADTVNAYLNLGKTRPPHQAFDDFCWDIYAEINARYSTDEALMAKRKEITKSIEAGTNTIAQTAAELVEELVFCHLLTLQPFGITYDLLVYESDVVNFGFWEHAFEALKTHPKFYLATQGKNEGCWVLRYSDKEDGEKVFVRKDGTKVYTAKDTAYHMWKFGLLGKDFLYKPLVHPDLTYSVWKTNLNGEVVAGFGNGTTIISVIDERQAYPQAMVKQAFSALGYEEQAKNYHHLAYGVVSLSKTVAKDLGLDVSSGKKAYAMSGRKGIGVKVTDFFNLVTQKIVTTKKVTDPVKAKKIAVGAIRHYMLKSNYESEIIFDTDEALAIEGNTGPYIQYAYARSSSILKKAESESVVSPVVPSDVLNSAYIFTAAELKLISQLALFPEVVDRAVTQLSLSGLADYVFTLCSAFNSFYHASPVLSATDLEAKKIRLSLVVAFGLTVTQVMAILGIPEIKEM